MLKSRTDAWFADRAPGIGKAVFATPGSAASNVPIGGIIGIGNSTTPPPSYPFLPEAGAVMPEIGNTAARVALKAALRHVAAFPGTAMMRNIRKPANSKVFSGSAWVNFGRDIQVGFNPTPAQGMIFINNANGGLDAGSGLAEMNFSPSGFATAGGGAWGASAAQFPFMAPQSVPDETALQNLYPSSLASDIYNQGWVHIMASFQAQNLIEAPGSESTFIGQGIATLVINNTVFFSGDIFLKTDGSGGGSSPSVFNLEYNLSDADAGDGTHYANSVGGSGIGGTQTVNGILYPTYDFGAAATEGYEPTDGSGLYAAVSEFWLDTQHFVDWTDPLVRAKFQISDVSNLTFAPCYLGPAGALPFGWTPDYYFGGNATLFPRNRAHGETATMYGSLINVDVPVS